jgi:outer membrane receptor protein involved in Fe transport
MFVDDQNTQSTGDYFYANTMAGADVTLNKLKLMLSIGVNNFLNRRYVGYININSYPRFYEPGEPRNYFVNLTMGYRF